MTPVGPLAVAVLGLLAERPRHPYDIAFTMQTRHMNEHIKLSLGTLYHVVEQLHRLGWIRPTETEREGRRPERTIYELTDEGRSKLQDRVRQLVAEPTRDYSAFEAGLTFMHLLPKEDAVTLLRQRAETLGEQIELCDFVLQRLSERGLARLALIEVELVQDTRRFQREWARRLAEEIESGSLEWNVLQGDCADGAEGKEVAT